MAVERSDGSASKMMKFDDMKGMQGSGALRARCKGGPHCATSFVSGLCGGVGKGCSLGQLYHEWPNLRQGHRISMPGLLLVRFSPSAIMVSKQSSFHEFGDSQLIPGGGSVILTIPAEGCVVEMRVKEACSDEYVPATMTPAPGPLIIRDDGRGALCRHQLRSEGGYDTKQLPFIVSGAAKFDGLKDAAGQLLDGQYQIIREQHLDDVEWFLAIVKHQESRTQREDERPRNAGSTSSEGDSERQASSDSLASSDSTSTGD